MFILGRKAMTNLDSIKKQRHHFTDKRPYSQSNGFFSSHVWMWDLDHKEGWAPKNWCLWTVVTGEDSWESLGLQEDQTSQSWRKSTLNIHWKDWCWSWSSNNWPPDWKSQLIRKDPDAGKDWRQEEKGTTEDEMVGWHHQLNISLSKLWKMVKDREARHAAVHGITKSWTWFRYWTSKSWKTRGEFSGKCPPYTTPSAPRCPVDLALKTPHQDHITRRQGFDIVYQRKAMD